MVDFGTHEEDGPGTWEIPVLPRELPANGGPDPNPSGPRSFGERMIWEVKEPAHSLGGRPDARGTGATADEAGKSEGRIRAMTLGNGVAPGARLAKAARVGTNFRRET